VFDHVGFFFRFRWRETVAPTKEGLMNKFNSIRSQEIDPTAGDGVARDGVAGDGVGGSQPPGTNYMDMSNSAMAEQIAQVAIAFEQRRTGHRPQSATVVLSENMLVITLHGALSPAEKALAKSPEGAAQVQDFHRQLFTSSADSLRQEIKRITGVEVREATAEVETTTGAVVHAFTTGAVVQVFLLACNVPSGAWSGNGQPNQS